MGYKGHTPEAREIFHGITYWYCKCGQFLGYSRRQARHTMRYRHYEEIERERAARSK